MAILPLHDNTGIPSIIFCGFDGKAVDFIKQCENVGAQYIVYIEEEDQGRKPSALINPSKDIYAELIFGDGKSDVSGLAKNIAFSPQEIHFIPDFIINFSSHRTIEGEYLPEFLEDMLSEYDSIVFLDAFPFQTATALSQELGYDNIAIFNGVVSASAVEFAVSVAADKELVQSTEIFFRFLGLQSEQVADRVGLIVPRVLVTLINEAAFAVMEKTAEPEDIDKAMTLGVNYPKGLLAWADEIGLDVVVQLLDALEDEYRQERYRTCVLLRQYVRAGWIGSAVGRGFYIYE